MTCLSTEESVREAIAATQLSGIINESAYIPFNNSALSFVSLAVIFNDIVINKRKVILELGSGISTILIARLIRRNKLRDVSLISVEHDNEWLSFVRNGLKSEGLAELVEFVHAPLVDCGLALDSNKWYSTDVLKDFLTKKSCKLDSVIVDGPPAWSKELEYSRYPAFPFFIDFLKADCSFFLDDINRNGEKEIIEKWRLVNFKRIDFTKSFCGNFRGKYYNIQTF